jgi:UDP-N-acetylglucosamine--N-acetylmuramyl-(pentapeptide) pyrophosphoryl-undecaprenol N-acetylglucosamine transferase
MVRPALDIILAAGGTGGHMIPAQALAEELKRRGHNPLLLTDRRGMRFARLFEGVTIHEIASGRMQGGILGRVAALFGVIRGTWSARRLFRKVRPAAVVGFGGYPSLPAGFAAAWTGTPLCLHEQNAVFGRANRFLARMAKLIALSFEGTRRVPNKPRAVITGNPVRSTVAALHDRDFAAFNADSIMRILVIGGSQGARILSDVVPSAISALPRALLNRLQITQQCREEDMDRVRARYEDMGVAAEITPFIDDLPARLEWTHLVISRAGASTVSELAAAGRPAVLVPLAIATDDHQTANAGEMVRSGGGWIMAEPEFTPPALAKLIAGLARAPERLRAAADAARKAGRPGAAHKLADAVEQMILVSGPVAALNGGQRP